MSFNSDTTSIIEFLITTQPLSPYQVSLKIGKNPQWFNYRLSNPECGFGILALRDLIAILNADKTPSDNRSRKSAIAALFGCKKPQRGHGRLLDALPDEILFREILTPNLRAKCRNAGVNYRQINYFINHTGRIDIPSRHIASLLTTNEIPRAKRELFWDWLFSVKQGSLTDRQAPIYHVRLPQ